MLGKKKSACMELSKAVLQKHKEAPVLATWDICSEKIENTQTSAQ
jgi:hypothetical protein